MPAYYPIFLNISGRRCVVIGGGVIAERKIVNLLDAGASVEVVSPDLTPLLQDTAECGRILHRARAYQRQDLEGATLAFAATNCRDVNAQIARDASLLGVQVCVADEAVEGSFVTPSIVRRGEFCLAISTGGSNPMLAARISDELELRFGEEYGAFVEILSDIRAKMKEQTGLRAARQAAAAAVLDHELELLSMLSEGLVEEAHAHALHVARSAAFAVEQLGSTDG